MVKDKFWLEVKISHLEMRIARLIRIWKHNGEETHFRGIALSEILCLKMNDNQKF